MFNIQRLALRCNWRTFRRVSRSAFSFQCYRTYSSQTDDNYNKNESFFKNMKNSAILGNPVLGVGIGAGIGLGYYLYSSGDNETVHAASSVPPGTGGKFVQGLPTYPMTEVTKHITPKDRVWTTFNQGVYDVTDFIQSHPGGDDIYMAAGRSLEHFWMIYPFHKDEDILAYLEEFRIGNLTEEEAEKNKPNYEDPFIKEPKRNPDIVINSAKPLVSETPLPLLMKHGYITPADLVFVRNHFPVPFIEEKDLDSYKIKFGGIGITPTELSLNDIKTKFPKHTITATLTCAGNRRGDMILSKEPRKYKGLLFGAGAISCVKMSGAKLYDVLTFLGLDPKDPRVKYIQFDGLDKEPNRVPYGSSVPIDKAMDPLGDVLLCYEMNGEPLLPDHGFPIRSFIPGYVGARSVKWLAAVTATDKLCDSFWQKIDYKYLAPGMNFNNTTFADLEKAPPANGYPINSAICEPLSGETVTAQNGKIHLKGYAFAGGGNKILRVDVTANCGKNWYVAKITHESDDKPPHNWAWSLWEIDIPVEATGKQVELWVKGVDQNGNTQSERFQNCFNFKGILANAYHRVRINVK